MNKTGDLMTQIDRLVNLSDVRAQQEVGSQLKTDLGRLLMELAEEKERSLRILERFGDGRL